MSSRSVIVGGQGSLDGLPGFVVEPDGGGECEDAGEDSDGHPGWGLAAVSFQVELAFEGLVDRLDDLP